MHQWHKKAAGNMKSKKKREMNIEYHFNANRLNKDHENIERAGDHIVRIQKKRCLSSKVCYLIGCKVSVPPLKASCHHGYSFSFVSMLDIVICTVVNEIN